MATTRISDLVVPLRWRRRLTWILLVLTAAGITLNAVVATPTAGFLPIDYATFGPPGAEILRGHWGDVFGDPIIQAGPIELIMWGIPYLIGVNSYVGWIVVALVFCTAFAIVFSLVLERVLRPLTPDWSITLAVGATAVASLSGLLNLTIASGHPAEFVIPVLWIISGMLARQGRSIAAAAVLASTAGWELWGLLGVPILLLAPRIDLRTVWRSAVGGIAVLAVLFVPFVLLGPFDMFSFRWPIHSGTLAYLLVPDGTSFPWPLRLAQGVLSVGAGCVVALLCRRRPDAIWLIPLAVCVVRLFIDPVLADYYAAPPLLMLLIGATFAIAQRAVIPFVACLVMFNVLLDVPLTFVTAGIAVVLAAVTTFVVVRRPAILRRLSGTAGDVVDVGEAK